MNDNDQDLFFKKIVVQFLILFPFFLGLIGLSLLPFWVFLGFTPDFFMTILYLWMIYRPDLIHFPLLVIVGAIQDGLYHSFLGGSILEILVLFFLTQFLKKRIFYESFTFVWGGYTLYLISYLIMEWGILSWIKGQALPFLPLFKSMIFNFLTYPILCKVSLMIQRRVDSYVDH